MGLLEASRTIPELLFVVEAVGHLKCHVVFGYGLLKSSSPAKQPFAEDDAHVGRGVELFASRAGDLPRFTRRHASPLELECAARVCCHETLGVKYTPVTAA